MTTQMMCGGSDWPLFKLVGYVQKKPKNQQRYQNRSAKVQFLPSLLLLRLLRLLTACAHSTKRGKASYTLRAGWRLHFTSFRRGWCRLPSIVPSTSSLPYFAGVPFHATGNEKAPAAELRKSGAFGAFGSRAKSTPEVSDSHHLAYLLMCTLCVV